MRSEHDYSINLKAELEIRHLHEKIDPLLMNQWQRLLEIQEIQSELREELNRKTPKAHPGENEAESEKVVPLLLGDENKERGYV